MQNLNVLRLINFSFFRRFEPFSYLLFLKRLADRENATERQANRKRTAYQPKVPKEMRWGYWTQMKAEEALNLQEEFARMVARVESLRGRMAESTRQVEGLFESLLAEAFD